MSREAAEATSSRGLLGGVPERTEWSALERESSTVSEMEMIMNRTRPRGELGEQVGRAARAKCRLRTLSAECAARSADLPCCSSTTPIRNRQMMT